MDYQFFAILLLLVGFVLIVAEVFLPSGGMILVLCAVAFIASFWCATKAWYGTQPFFYGVYLASLVVLIPTVVIGAFQVFPRTAFGRNLIGAPTLEEVTPHAEERARLAEYIGRIGRALTPLTPGGLVMIDSERLHAFSEGVLIDRDSPVEIVAVRGTRVLVRAAPAAKEEFDRSPPEADRKLVRNDDDAPESPLDFAIPQG
ncbi:MAG: NfeD family protein [Planctomycetaceae bacterium]